MSTWIPPSPEPGGKLPDCRGLRTLRHRGWSYAEIENEYGVSNQAVTAKLRSCGLVEERVDYSGILPWKIRPEDRNKNIYILLKCAARQKMGVGKPLTPRKQKEVDYWLKSLKDNDVVVMYGTARIGDEIIHGFHYVPRRPTDQWIIRIPAGWQPTVDLAANG